MIFFTQKNNKVDRIKDMATHPGEGWSEAPDDWGGYHGLDLEWLDKDYRLIPEHELIKQGKRKDNRGKWYHKDKIGETKLIQDLDVEAGEDYTKEAPLENEPFQNFDRKKNKWVVDEKKKERAEKEAELAKIQSEIDDAERRLIRSMRAEKAGRTTERDDEEFNKWDSLIEEELRPQYNKVEDELKKLKSA